MDFFLWDVVGDADDESLCFIEGSPEGMGLHASRLKTGRPAAKYVPNDAKIQLRKENPGLALPGFIGNTSCLLILSREGLAVVEKMCRDVKFEFFEFALLNHKKRLHSSDYVIVNPLTKLEALDPKASGVKYDESGEVGSIERLVLSKHKVANAPHLFRLAEDPVRCIFSRELGRAFNAANITNVRGQLLKQA